MSSEMDRGFTSQPPQTSTDYYHEAASSSNSLDNRAPEGFAWSRPTSPPIPPVQFASIRQQQPNNRDNTPISRTPSQQQQQQQQQRQFTSTTSLDRAGTPFDRHAFGHIPGINPGHTWKRRDQASVAGVHPPPQAGIFGTEKRGGAVSVVLNDGYPDGDCGDIIWYMGSGGFTDGDRKSHTMLQNQDLSKGGNAALRMSVETGLPVRVLRGSDARHSPWAPESGYRYDGLYEVTRFERVPDPTGNTQYTCLIFRMERLECDRYTIPIKVGFGEIAETKARQANARLLEEDRGDDLAPNNFLQRHRTSRPRQSSHSQPRPSQPRPSKLNSSHAQQRRLSQNHTSAPLLQGSSTQAQQPPRRPVPQQPVLVEPASEYKQVLNKLSFKKVKKTAASPPAAIEASTSSSDAPQPQNPLEALHVEKPASPHHQHHEPTRAPSPPRARSPTRARSPIRPPPLPSHRPPNKRPLPTSPPARVPHPSSRPNPPDHSGVDRASHRHEERVMRRADDDDHVRHDRRERWRDDRGGDNWRRSHGHHRTSVDHAFSRHAEPVSRRDDGDEDDGGRMRHDARERRRDDRAGGGGDCWRPGHVKKPHPLPARPPASLHRRASNSRSPPPPPDKRARHQSAFPYQRPPRSPTSSHGHSYRPPHYSPPPSRAHAESPHRPSYPALPAPTENASVVVPPQALSTIPAHSTSVSPPPVVSSPPALPTPKQSVSPIGSPRESPPPAIPCAPVPLVHPTAPSLTSSPQKSATVAVTQQGLLPQHDCRVSEEAPPQDGGSVGGREEKPLFLCSSDDDGSSNMSLESSSDAGAHVEQELSPLPLDDFSGLADHAPQQTSLSAPQSPIPGAASKEMMMCTVKVEEDDVDGDELRDLDSHSDVCTAWSDDAWWGGAVLEKWCGLDELWQNEIVGVGCSVDDQTAGKRVLLDQQTGLWCIADGHGVLTEE